MGLTTSDEAGVSGEYVRLDDEDYFRIANCHLMPDFFMSLVGASDHWMFVSSNGSLTAGRQNPDLALFPYASDDQLSAARDQTGPKTLIRTLHDGQQVIWEPFAQHTSRDFVTTRNLYKSPLGNKLIFEEVNETLQLTFRYRWAFSHRFGFVRSCRLENHGQSARSLDLLDGLQNVLPYGVESEFNMRYSNLANAYKKSELIDDSQIGLFYLSSIPTDKAEPSEGLKATTVWHSGFDSDATLLSSTQLKHFVAADAVKTEQDIRGRAGAYLVTKSCEMPSGDTIQWQIVAELAQDHSAIVGLNEWLQHTADRASEIDKDINESEQEFLRIISYSDGIQLGANRRLANRHFSNTVFNVMRGGIPLDNYDVLTSDFIQHVSKFNRSVYDAHLSFLEGLPATIGVEDLRTRIGKRNDANLTRLGMEYLPLAFSRRHGDPTRPWNRFSIDLRSEDGRTNLNYQGNWRDIFQNWEALSISFPRFTTAMICRFLNATTADGYNPYRVTKDGFEWEEPHADDPWANIGYWGDHQIIYLLKLLEWTRRFDPQAIDGLLNSRLFAHANIPYRIKSYEEIKTDSCDTILFDRDAAKKIQQRVESIGADGKLIHSKTSADQIHQVTLVEKLLTLSLAKLSNFIPDGGIWLNTQRPEWNDANNALVGNGLSVVTTCYLHRWFQFLHEWISTTNDDSFEISTEVADFFEKIAAILQGHVGSINNGSQGPCDPATRQQIVNALSTAGSQYRATLYTFGMSGKTKSITRKFCLEFLETSRQYVKATIRNNKRPDGLYHAYNLIDFREDGVEIEHLYEMVEGQVAVLSSGLLSASEVVELLDSLRDSALYRENQDSYLLYPDRQLPRFLEKNCLDDGIQNSIELVQKLLEDGNEKIVKQDARGTIHFNGDFRNSYDLRAALDKLGAAGPEYSQLIIADQSQLVSEFEKVFAHRQFTGRSGTFFGYEGLGSIYWHMVSKLALAVVENFFWAIEAGESTETVNSLRSHYHAIRRGIGAEKKPTEYGAFPTDPYSHTPENAGVKQPGMTGQVKEDILSRFAELGVHIHEGCLCFRMDLFDRSELLAQPGKMTFCNVQGEFQSTEVPKNGFGFTMFQVPIVYVPGDANIIEARFKDGSSQLFEGMCVDHATSQQLFSRSGTIDSIRCQFKALS